MICIDMTQEMSQYVGGYVHMTEAMLQCEGGYVRYDTGDVSI